MHEISNVKLPVIDAPDIVVPFELMVDREVIKAFISLPWSLF